MNVLHIGKFFSPFKGGVETYLEDLMRAAQEHGVRSAALVHNHVRSFRSREETFETGLGSLQVCRAASWSMAFFTPISPAFRANLHRMIQGFQPDLLHVHLPNPSVCWLLTLASARRLPLVVHWHSDVVTSELGTMMRILYSLYRPLERKLLRRASAIVATSESYLASSDSLSEFPDKCQVVPLGLDTRKFAGITGSEPGLQLPERDLQVLSIGRLTYYKGYGYLIRAMARVKGVQLHIVGDGELRRELQQLAEQLELGSRVVFHGGLDDEGLARRLQACDCLCLASTERTEAFGLVLLESMYFGRATIASRVEGSGMAWVVQDGVTGITVQPRNVGALAQALEQLRDNPGLLREYGANGRRRFEQHFEISHSADALARVYRNVLPAGQH